MVLPDPRRAGPARGRVGAPGVVLRCSWCPPEVMRGARRVMDARVRKGTGQRQGEPSPGGEGSPCGEGSPFAAAARWRILGSRRQGPPVITQGDVMQYFTFTRRRLAGAAAGMICAAALIPVASLAGPASATAGTETSAAGTGAASVPTSFQPVSASFQSAARGFVLGAAGCRQVRACQARLATTTDAGAYWRFTGAPDVRLFNAAGNTLTQASKVRDVVFASRRTGWLYGPGLWATHDGGATWRKITLGGDIVPSQGGGVVAMAAAAGTAYAVVAPDPFHGKPAELYASPAGQDAWARVGTMTGGPSWASLAVAGTAAWFGTSAGLWATADGVHWHQDPVACPASDIGGLGSIAAASPSRVVFLCLGDGAAGSMGKDVLRSSDGGTTVRLAGQAPLAGSGGQ